MRGAGRALLVLLLSLGFALSPGLSGGFAGLSPVQFPLVHAFWPAQPLPAAFAIWGPIFLLLIAGAGYGLWRHRRDAEWQAMRLPLAVSLGLGVFWIAVANSAPLAATVMIIFMAAAATDALLRAPRSPWAGAPVGLYAGWLTAAGAVAVAATLSGYGVMTPQAAALLLLAGLGAIAALVLWHRPRALSYAAAVGWAFGGVILANLPVRNLPVIALCAALLVLLAALALRPRSA